MNDNPLIYEAIVDWSCRKHLRINLVEEFKKDWLKENYQKALRLNEDVPDLKVFGDFVQEYLSGDGPWFEQSLPDIHDDFEFEDWNDMGFSPSKTFSAIQGLLPERVKLTSLEEHARALGVDLSKEDFGEQQTLC